LSEAGDGNRTVKGYPACSKTVTDRCIQLHERGVATRTNLALNDRLGMLPVAAMGGPYEPSSPDRSADQADPRPWPRTSRSGYPPCSRTLQDRCIQLYERGVGGRGN
jgi:hypothetical protein